MATRAFILIETQVGRTKHVAETLRSFRGVKSADVVTGQFDVIALVEVQDLREMADLILPEFRGLTGWSGRSPASPQGRGEEFLALWPPLHVRW